MPDARAWAREARLLMILNTGTRAAQNSAIEDLLAADFLLQHPSLLVRFVDLANDGWRFWSLPSAAEADSTEEALLHWKRAVGTRIVAPMLGRLIARELVTHRRGLLRVTPNGMTAATAAAAKLEPLRLERIVRTTESFRSNPAGAHKRLRRVLVETTSDG
jgi:hypothetical protein